MIPITFQTIVVDFETMNSVGSNNLILKYLRFILSGCRDIGIRKFEFVAIPFRCEVERK